MNPNTIGGTFYLNCAYLGIPCIGNKHTNTQKLCFPDLSVEPHDLKKAKKLAEKLRNNAEFYVNCSTKAIENYKKYFSEDSYIKHMKQVIKEVMA